VDKVDATTDTVECKIRGRAEKRNGSGGDRKRVRRMEEKTGKPFQSGSNNIRSPSKWENKPASK